ncbi:MAG: fluoride efflux transporter CrcB [Pseudomonadota bacterium]|jgi:CrcB protein
MGLTVVAISLGAAVGALARWRLGLWLNPPHALLPWGTLCANWVGAYAIGVVVVYLQQHSGLDPLWRAALVTGLLGGLTTFSSFSMETVALLQNGRLGLAAANTGLHVLGSLTLTWAGVLSAQTLWPNQG